MNWLEYEIDRRKFLQLTLTSSAVLLASRRSLEATADAASSLPVFFGELRSLPPGAIRPAGWLQLYLEKQAAQLGSHLPQVSWPFTDAYWAGEERAESWWPWEQKGYWIDGATRLALVLGDQRLMAQVETSLRYTLKHAAANGYLGPAFIENPKGDYHRWPQAVFFRALTAAAEAGEIRNVAEALRKHYLSDEANYGKPNRNIMNVEDILWCYDQTGDVQLLALAESAWREFSTPTKPGDNPIDLSALRVFSASPINAHGVNYIETSKQPAILYLYTGNESYLKFALAAQRRIFDHHMLIDGIPSTSEFYRTRTSLDSHETCDITDHTWSWGYMLMATGDSIWADRIERACFNAGFGAIKKDWKALQYFSCPNQFLATLNSDHNVLDWRDGRSQDGGRMMAYQPNPGQKTACCGGNVHRLLPNFVIRMWMKSTNGGLAAVLYGPSRLTTMLGTDSQEVEIIQDTDYPFDETIKFTIRTSKPIQFPLLLRIPAWCNNPHISVNGKPIGTLPLKEGFATLSREFNPGDVVTLILPMKVRTSRWPQNGIGLEHGPLVYSLPIQESWAAVVEPKYTTKEFPSWNATPVSEWNYAVDLDPQLLEEQVKLTRKAMTKDPWVDPPVTLTVPARAVDDWKLQQNPDDLSQSFTPPLPELDSSKISDTIERIALTPLGSTHLRVTIFPDLRGGKSSAPEP